VPAGLTVVTRVSELLLVFGSVSFPLTLAVLLIPPT
jgi:hypothetical protein